ncbi:MAG TPA: hypothetical protein VD902_09955 [Symbiobacteriaceae bacterium]|nr:hypothetical protein [Symbiobacteriaceae bacterium]
MEFNWMDLLAAFGGGLFGAAIGGLPAFIFTGLVVLAGVAAGLGGSSYDLVGGIAFGPIFGPHVAFGGGVAAAAYAARKDIMPTGGKDITAGLAGLGNPMVLLVGGLFGMGGYLVQKGLATFLTGYTDTVAVTVILSALVVRLMFGKTGIFGTPTKEALKAGRFTPSGAAVWAPWQQDWVQVLTIGLGASFVSAWIALQFAGLDPKVAGLGGVVGFGISAFSLLFLQFGVKVPITHHMTLIAALAATTSGNLIIGVIFGMLSAVLGEVVSRLFQIHGDTHIDPPANAIWVMTLVVLVLGKTGIF